MSLSFVHMADVHLGYQQYGHPERFNDFGRAFLHATSYAADHQVDFVLISGDLFHKSRVEPSALLQAVGGLGTLREAGIPVAAVAGNHDRSRYLERASWLDYLAETRYLALLAPTIDDDGIHLRPWDGHEGTYIDVKGTRIYGLPYYGSSTPRVLDQLPGALATQDAEGVAFTVLMGHFGLEGEMPNVPGGLPHSRVAPLHEHVDYLALGHWHKPFERERWIFNPGSLEICGMDERHWNGGFYHVTLSEGDPSGFNADHVVSADRRRFYRWTLEVDEYASPEALYDAVRARLLDEKRKLKADGLPPVVELSLEGILAFDRSALDMEHVQALMDDIVAPLVSRPRNHTRATEFEIAPQDGHSRAELERQVLQDLIRRDARYSGRADEWAGLISEVKAMVLGGSPPQAVTTTLRQRLKQLNED
jgi:exonuclease SbcD